MKLIVYFDYACPYCYRGHKNLLEILKELPNMEVEWRPCEAHPRPEISSIYSDIAIQGMFWIREQKGNLMPYHLNVFRAMFDQRKDISDIEVLKNCAEESGIDIEHFAAALLENRCAGDVQRANEDAWEAKGLMAVPSYFMGQNFIGSRDGLMVTGSELRKFIINNK